MYVHRSNRTETLVAELAALVTRPAADAFGRECIVVQGKGMERWLSMQLARRLGVWANPDFPFPRKLIERALTAVGGPEVPGSACFAPETLMWAIADLLPRFVDRPEFAPIRGYLAGDERAIRRIQLAARIADTFDQYVVYRPEMVLTWERGDGTDWQAVLWQELVKRHGSTHVAARARTVLAAVGAGKPCLADFPSRVSIFGVSTLPPLYLNVLIALSPWIELHLFILSPSREYWADICSRREVLRALAKRPAAALDAEAALHLEEGNPVLASLGRQGREFQQLLEAGGDYQEEARDLYHDPGAHTALTAMQSDILNLRHRGTANADVPPLVLDAQDHSISVHACHGPMREVEVLHDQLLALFDEDPTVEPRDVVVMSPAIDAYAPFIDAVFGETGDRRPRIPYRVADRHVRATDEIVDAFANVLDVLRGRMTATAVLDLLGTDVIRARFGVEGEELDLARTWIVESGIRWGVDATHRGEVGQPARAENTWRFGLDRLLLGYAMPGNGRTLYRDVLPHDDMEGTTTELLGKLADFCDKLFALRASLQQPRTLDAWRDDLGKLLDTMVANTSQTAYQQQRIRSALAELAENARTAGFDAPVDLDSVRAQLEQSLQRGATAHGFLSGGVTFCALVPMRTIPFRVICLLGMNDDAFPRVRRPLGFDLIAQHPRPGDRSSRDDDRYLFLEALLSARDRLLITYVGQSLRDNAEIPPSVAVSELFDALDESFRLAAQPAAPRQNAMLPPEQKTVREHLLVRHPLQAFSPRYFSRGDSRLFSYAKSYCDGARSLAGPRYVAPAFLSRPLPADSSARVTVDEVARFFKNPVHAFLQRRLGLFLDDSAEVIADREPITLNHLEQWGVGSDLLDRALDTDDLDQAFSSIRASGRLPLGTLGTCLYQELKPEVIAVAKTAAPRLQAQRLDPVVVDAEIDGTRITGLIRNVWPDGQVEHHYSKLGGTSELRLWIRHLVLNWAAPQGFPKQSILVGRPEHDGGPMAIRFRPVEDAGAVLRGLLQLYWLGQMMPLPFFPKSSRAYVEALRRPGGTEENALHVARGQFRGSRHSPVPADADDPCVQQVFGSRDPFSPAFSLFDSDISMRETPRTTDLARTIFEPLLDHREDAA
ncbi:MAG: exodeoxyribonuclease V subunit gamma [Candidatus Binatia bacterium]